MFERSAAGQRNRALFYGVNYVCYVEGGGHDPDRSIDSLFWEQVLAAYRPDLTFVFLPRGGKPILETLAKQVVDDNIANTIVTMDSDYDELLNHKISDNRILYSFGYSWENDVYDEDFLPLLVRTLAHKSGLSPNSRAMLSDGYRRLQSEARRAIAADLIALIAGSSVLPRDAPGRVITTDPHTTFPVMNKRELVKLTRAANEKTRPRQLRGTPPPSTGLKHFVGHCLSHAVAILIRSVMKEMGLRRSIGSDHLRDVAITLLGKQLLANPNSDVSTYHSNQCLAIP